MHSLRRLWAILAVAALLTILPAAPPAYAQSFTVTNTTDIDDGITGGCGGDGCSLREAIRLANANGVPDTITFSLAGAGPHYIRPSATLPILSGGDTTIDAGTAHNIVLSGAIIAAGSGVGYGLVITSSNNTIRGLVIVGFPGTGDLSGGSAIFIDGELGGGDNNRIYNTWLGVGPDGNTADGNARYGVLIANDADNNIIGGTGANERNVIAANGVAGVIITTAGNNSPNNGNQIVGNYIGTNVAGTAIPTGTNNNSVEAGIFLSQAAVGTLIADNLVGGLVPTGGPNPVIAGIKVASFGTALPADRAPRDTTLVRNLVGVNSGGTVVANRVGILIGGVTSNPNYGPFNTVIGDPANPAGGRNVIAGNTGRGIEISDTSARFGDITIAGNYIGLGPNGELRGNGTPASGSTGEGILVGRQNLASAGTSGRVTIGPGNVISSNTLFGVRVRSGGHVIRGNYIGTDRDGASSALPTTSPTWVYNTANGAASIFLENGDGVTVGGSSPADRNIIAFSATASGPVGAGIIIDPNASGVTNGCSGPCSTGGHTVQNNYIGVRRSGDGALNGNLSQQPDREGIWMSGTSGNTISGNVIAGLGVGMTVGTSSAPSSNNIISGNRIGTRASGSTDFGTGIGNQNEGIRIIAGTGNRIENNLLGFNGAGSAPGDLFPAIRVGNPGTSASDNEIIGNRLARNGAAFGGDGVYVDTATQITISRSATSFTAGNGIVLANGGNGGRTQPTISGVTTGSPPVVSGSTNGCSGCTVEIFTSPIAEAGEGPVFLASGTASGTSFSIPIPGCQRYLTATVTDASGNTSPFGGGQAPPSTTPFDTGASGPCVAPLNLTLSSASPASRNVAPGASTIYTHTLTHNAQVARTYTVQITSTLGWASAPAFVSVPAAPPSGTASADFGVTVAVPAGTSNGTQDVTTVRAVLTGGSSSNQVTDTTTAQAAAPNPAAPSVSPGQTKPLLGATTTFTHTVTNIGGLTGTFEVVGLAFTGTPPPGWGFASATIVPSSIPGGGTATLAIVVNTPGSPPPGNVSFSFRVGVVSGQQTDPVVDTITIAAVRDFEFTPDGQLKSTPAGADVFFDYTLTNTGNAPDSFSVTGAPSGGGNPLIFVGSAIAPGSPSPSLTNLAPGASAIVRVTFRVPSGTLANDYPVTVTAQATGGSGAPPPVTLGATVRVTGGGAVQILPGAGTPNLVNVVSADGVVTFTNLVTNTGNLAVPISVPASFTAPTGWSATTTGNTCDDTVTIAAGATCTFTVTVSVPQGADGGSYPIIVSATAENADPIEDVTATAINTVNVLVVRGVALAPNRSQEGAPNQVLTFTHTLTNTGNAPDSFTLSVSASLPGWSVVLTPTSISNLPRNGTRPVTVTAVVPPGAVDTITNTLIVTATGVSGGPSASVVDQAGVATITAGELSPGQRRNVDAGASVVYTHTVTNTGTVATRYEVSVENSGAGWLAVVSGSPTPLLDPGETAEVSVQVTAPITASIGLTNTTLLRLFAQGTTTPLLDTAEDITQVGPAFGVILSPDNTGEAAPDSTAVFTHTLQNIGTTQGLFSLTVAESNGWPATVAPSLVNLGPGQSLDITVRVTVPDGLRAGAPGFARVTARLVSDPDVTDDATNEITVQRVAGVDLSASQVRTVTPGGPPLSLGTLAVYNRGSATDRFTLTPIGVPAGWAVTITPASVLVDKDSTARVAVTVSVPASVPIGTVQTVRVEAVSEFDSSARSSVQLTFVYLGDAVQQRTRLFMPVLAR